MRTVTAEVMRGKEAAIKAPNKESVGNIFDRERHEKGDKGKIKIKEPIRNEWG